MTGEPSGTLPVTLHGSGHRPPRKTDAAFRANSLSAAGILSCVRVAETDKRISILAAELDAYPELMTTLSGVVDLRTGEIRPHDPKLLLTRITACPADISAPHPRWDAFLAETFNGNREMTAYLQRLAGLALLGKTPEHVFPFFWGKGANGKTVIANVLQGLMFAQSRRLAAHYLDRRINFPAICLGTLGQVAAADIRI